MDPRHIEHVRSSRDSTIRRLSQDLETSLSFAAFPRRASSELGFKPSSGNFLSITPSSSSTAVYTFDDPSKLTDSLQAMPESVKVEAVRPETAQTSQENKSKQPKKKR